MASYKQGKAAQWGDGAGFEPGPRPGRGPAVRRSGASSPAPCPLRTVLPRRAAPRAVGHRTLALSAGPGPQEAGSGRQQVSLTHANIRLAPPLPGTDRAAGPPTAVA